MICDFCLTAHKELWGFHVDEFDESGIHNLDGEWAACDDCLPLVKTRDYIGLFERALRLNPTLRLKCLTLHRLVMAHMTGDVEKCSD